MRALLESAFSAAQEIEFPIGRIQSVGSTALEVVSFLTILIKTGRREVFERFFRRLSVILERSKEHQTHRELSETPSHLRCSFKHV